MKKRLQISLPIMLIIASLGSFAQDEKERITIEITKEIDGEKRTFKGTYNSTEEMKADPNYQEFADEEDNFNFWVSPDQDVIVRLDQFKDMNKHFFGIFDDEDGKNSLFFHPSDSASKQSFDFHFGEMNWEELGEKMHDLGADMHAYFDRFHDDDTDAKIKTIELKRIEVTEVADEFGKQGKVAESNKLILEDLSFYPNPSSNGKIKVKFTTPSEDQLSIKVSTLEGKEVFSRTFDQFSGTYAETIDLSKQKEGVYLMEIAQGKKRLTKKIVIN